MLDPVVAIGTNWKYIVVDDKELKNKVASATFDKLVKFNKFALQTPELGLDTCMIGWFNQKRILELFNIPKQKTIGLVITLGYEPNEVSIISALTEKRIPNVTLLSINQFRFRLVDCFYW